MAKKKAKGPLTKTFVVNGKRYFVRGETPEELTDNYRRRYEEVINSSAKAIDDMTFNEYFERWIDDERDRIKESTVRNYTFWYHSAADIPTDATGILFGERQLVSITGQNCKDLQRTLLHLKKGDVKANCADPEKPLHGRTGINSIMFLMARVYKDAMMEKIGNLTDMQGRVYVSPFDCVKPYKRTEPEARDKQHRALTSEEIEKFLNAAKNTWYYNAYVALLYSGMRIGELSALKYSDIDFDKKVIHIERTTTRTETGARVVGETTKTKKSKRDIELSPVLETAINNQLDLNKATWGECPVVNIGEDNEELATWKKKKQDLQQLVFKTSENSLLCSTVLNRDITRKCKKAGIERFSAHAFRATRATTLIGNGVNPNTVKEVLGHSSYKMTCDLYSHALPELTWNEIAEIDAAVSI